MASFQAKMGGERLRKREKKIIVPINSYPTKNRKLKKKIAKKFKKLKNIVMASFQAKMGQERLARSTSSSLEDIQYLKKFRQLSLKPKNPSLRENTRKWE